MGVAGVLGSELAMVEALAWMPQRLALAASPLPDTQFAIGDFIAPAQMFNGTLFRFGPVFTYFVPARLARTPTKSDQARLAAALNTIESVYPFSPAGIFTFVSYGIPYFNRLPGGMTGSLVSSHLPLDIGNQPVLQEAVAGPTDITATNPGNGQVNFRVPVQIERNDLLFTLRSDSKARMDDVLNWLKGSGQLRGRAVPSPALGGLLQ